MPVLQRGNAQIYYEVHGEGDPVVCLGGWGSFCHGEHHHLPWGLLDRHQVIIMDYRGIGESIDDPTLDATMDLYARDVCAILDHLGLKNVHLLGMVGIGACVTQIISITRPDLARSMVNTGSWATMDRFLKDQLELFLTVHREMGFLAFQKTVSLLSFEPGYYAKNIDRLLGESGVWHHLNGRVDAHARFIEASVRHDVMDALRTVQTPSLILHAPLDQVTGPRTTKPIEDALPNARGHVMEGAAHVIAGRPLKQAFADLLRDFYATV